SPEDASRWYPGAGIYRNVWLVKTAPVHVGYNGTYVTTSRVEASDAMLNIVVNVENQASAAAKVTLEHQIFDLGADGQKGKSIGDVIVDDLDLPANGSNTNHATALIVHPKLWSTTNPSRYVVVTSILQQGKLLDRYETPFGIRTIQFTTDNGFLLNGEK